MGRDGQSSRLKLDNALAEDIDCGVNIAVMRRSACRTRPIPIRKGQSFSDRATTRAGLAGGIEPANLHQVTAFTLQFVLQFGGQRCLARPWYGQQNL